MMKTAQNMGLDAGVMGPGFVGHECVEHHSKAVTDWREQGAESRRARVTLCIRRSRKVSRHGQSLGYALYSIIKVHIP